MALLFIVTCLAMTSGMNSLSHASDEVSWRNRDIGQVGVDGGVKRSGSTFIVSGSGRDIWSSGDDFHFVYKPMGETGEFVSRITSLENTDDWAKAGLMIRERLTMNSAHAMMILSPGHGVSFQWRAELGGPMAHEAVPGIQAPVWLKLVRASSEFRGYYSTDGKAWQLVGKTKVSMPPLVHVGLISSSHDNSKLCAVTMDHVSLVGGADSFPKGRLSSVKTLEGFLAEEIYTVPRKLGSWIRMAFDDRGRIIVSLEGGKLVRVTLPSGDHPTRVEELDAPIHFAMGLLYELDSLYANGDGPEGTGLYRLRDLDGDDRFEKVELLMKWPGYMHDHGPHAISLGPDGKLYVLNGNFVKVPPNISERSAHKNYQEDLLLPRQWDATGWAVGIMSPGACLYRTGRDGKEWELLCGGFRNPYDFAFDADGEIFLFDSDMERHVGTPWYRPTRINHCVSGGEYGWRGGTGKGPTYYIDNLPGTVDIGLSSPTGVTFGTKSKFPPKYKRALFALDWQYGRILAVHLKPDGATYSGIFEEFLSGRPLSVTDVQFGPDGAMYFITGGRGTQSKLYRVTYEGSGKPEYMAPSILDASATEARALRHRLEAFHGKKSTAAIDTAWPHLNSTDRWIRFAARVAIEHQDPGQWLEAAFAEKRTYASLTSLMAVARTGQKNLLPRLIEKLGSRDWNSLSEPQKLDLLRIYAIAFIRLGPLGAEVRDQSIRSLDSLYPAASFPLNRELSELLVFLKAPGIIAKTMDLFLRTDVQEEEFHYAFILRNIREGWTLEQRENYFRWFIKSMKYRGGISVPGFARNIRADALATLSAGEKIRLEPVLQASYLAAVPLKAKIKFVKHWAMDDFSEEFGRKSRGHNAARGRSVFETAQCLACHHFNGEGGTVGPDITSVASRYNKRDLVETILLPSKVVSDQYQSTVVVKKNGEVLVGTLMKDEKDSLSIRTDPLDFIYTKVLKKDIRETSLSRTSTMPDGLLDSFTRNQILDLIAYIESGGKEGHRAFSK